MSVIRKIVGLKAVKAAAGALTGDDEEREVELQEPPRAEIVKSEPRRVRSIGMLAVGLAVGMAASWLLASRRRPDALSS